MTGFEQYYKENSIYYKDLRQTLYYQLDDFVEKDYKTNKNFEIDFFKSARKKDLKKIDKPKTKDIVVEISKKEIGKDYSLEDLKDLNKEELEWELLKLKMSKIIKYAKLFKIKGRSKFKKVGQKNDFIKHILSLS